MKPKLLFVLLIVAGPLFAADPNGLLLKGTNVRPGESRAEGEASAVIGDLQVAAAAITFDRQTNVLKCEGAVIVRTPTAVVKAQDCVIELSAGEKRVFFLSRGDIRIAPPLEPRPTTLLPAQK
jgi:hypothetical protein